MMIRDLSRHRSIGRVASVLSLLGFPPLGGAVFAGPAVAQDGREPLTIHVTDSARKETSRMGRLAAAISDGNVAASVTDLKRALDPHAAWLRQGGTESELWLVATRRSRTEVRKSSYGADRDKFQHVYRLEAALDLPGGSERIEVEARVEPDQRNDDQAFAKLGRDAADRALTLIVRALDRLRPLRPQTGLEHKVRYRMLVVPDGLEVLSVLPGSPADRAGLRPKDRIKALMNERDTGRMDRLLHTAWVQQTGSLQFEIERDKKRLGYLVEPQPRAVWDASFMVAPPGSITPLAPSPLRAPTAPPIATPAAAAPAPSAPAPAPASPAPASATFEIKPGMTEAEVARGLGEPVKKVKFAARSIWTYDGFAVTFQNGRVVEVK